MKPARTIWDEKERQFIFKCVDLFISFYAVLGVVGLAIRVASLNPQAKIGTFSPQTAAVSQPLMEIGGNLAFAAACLAYMLWRNQWRISLKQLFAVVIVWSVAVSAAMYWPIGIFPLIALMFAYCVYWSWQVKPTK